MKISSNNPLSTVGQRLSYMNLRINNEAVDMIPKKLSKGLRIKDTLSNGLNNITLNQNIPFNQNTLQGTVMDLVEALRNYVSVSPDPSKDLLKRHLEVLVNRGIQAAIDYDMVGVQKSLNETGLLNAVNFGAFTINNLRFDRENDQWTGTVKVGGYTVNVYYTEKSLGGTGKWMVKEDSMVGPYDIKKGFLNPDTGTIEVEEGTVHSSDPWLNTYTGKFRIDKNGAATVNMKLSGETEDDSGKTEYISENVNATFNPNKGKWYLANDVKSLGLSKGQEISVLNDESGNTKINVIISNSAMYAEYNITSSGVSLNAKLRITEADISNAASRIEKAVSSLVDSGKFTAEQAAKLITEIYSEDGRSVGEIVADFAKNNGIDLNEDEMKDVVNNLLEIKEAASTFKDMYDLYKTAKESKYLVGFVDDLTKLGKFGKALGIAGGILGIIGGAVEVSEGNYVEGGLDIASGGLAVAAIVMASTGVGAPLAGVVLGASMALGVASFALEHSDEIVNYLGDPEKIAKDLGNLLENAGEFGKKFADAAVAGLSYIVTRYSGVEGLGNLISDLKTGLNKFKNTLSDLGDDLSSLFTNKENEIKNEISKNYDLNLSDVTEIAEGYERNEASIDNVSWNNALIGNTNQKIDINSGGKFRFNPNINGEIRPLDQKSMERMIEESQKKLQEISKVIENARQKSYEVLNPIVKAEEKLTQRAELPGLSPIDFLNQANIISQQEMQLVMRLLR